MKQTIEMLIKRWINVLDEAQDKNKINDINAIVNHVKREMRYALKIMEQQEREDKDGKSK